MAMKWQLLVLVACMWLVIICNAKTVKITPKQSSNKLPFEFNEVIPNNFTARGFGGTWISGKEFTYTSNSNFVKYDIETSSTVSILSADFIRQNAWSGASFRYSNDLTKILVRYDQRQIFRHSTVSKFSIISLDNNNSVFKIADGGEIQIAFFTPSGNGLAYIQDNNIYYHDFNKVLGLPEIVTADGVPGVIYNGIPDWVYEEEVLGTDAATWFSPDGSKLAFIRFDDQNVKEAVYDIYGNGEQQYPEEVHLRYPKAGTPNPVIALYMVTLQAPFTRTELAVPIDKVTTDHILGTVFWVNDMTLGAIWLNRRQNAAVFVTYDTATYAMTELMEINEPNGWVDVNTPKCDANSVCYFINNFNNWPTLTSIDTKNKQDVQHLSSVGMNVLSLYGIEDGVVYYLSTPASDKSFNRHVYTSNGCLTCEIETPEGNRCTYATASFSKDFSHYSMTCSGPDVAFTKFFRTNGNQEIFTWETNDALRQKLSAYDYPKTLIFHVPVEGGFNAVVKMQVPNQLDVDSESPATKYPMLVRVYAGPGSVRVAETFGVGYQTYQITKKNIIYVEIDGRGTGQNGVDMMFSVNNRLGTYEMEDQIAVTKFLVNRYKFIDAARVAIWGWSYGGYATAMTLAQDTQKVFKCGISVAPVTSWRFYDTIYTERYMGINQNALNYNTSDVATPEHVKQIGNHEFFLIHGNADDNVHYQQSMVLARELEKADILFEQLSYPDEAHSISGTQRHLYHSMDRFWDKCFNLNN